MLRIKKEIFKETNMLFVSHIPFYCSLQNIKIALLSKGSSVPQWNCNNAFPKIMVSIVTDLSVIPRFSMHIRTWLHLNLHWAHLHLIQTSSPSLLKSTPHCTPVSDLVCLCCMEEFIRIVMQFNMKLLFQLRELFIKYSILLGLKQY